MTKKQGLNAKKSLDTKGLQALMGNIKKERQAVGVLPKTPTDDVLPTQKTAQSPKSVKKDSLELKKESPEQVALVQICVNQLQSGKYQPRRAMDESALEELADSIRQHGIMQPIVIRPLLAGEQKSDGVTHEIIAGERRWRAAKMAGLTTICAIERVLSDEVAIALALIENIQREDLHVLEQAAALQRFHTEFGMSHGMIAEVVGKARTTVSNLLRLNGLHDEVKAFMLDGFLDMGHARPLLSLSSEQQPIIAKKIIQNKMTVRDAEKLVKSILNPEPKPLLVASTELVALSQQLSDTLGMSVKLKQGKDKKGSIEIFFYNNDEFQTLFEKLSNNS